MLRTGNDVGDIPDFDDFARIEHGDAVGGFRNHAHVVRDEHDARAVLVREALQERNDLRLNRHVKRRCRLVVNDELRIRGERERNHDALAHAARKLVRVLFRTDLGRRNPGFAKKFNRALWLERASSPGDALGWFPRAGRPPS